MNQPIKRKAVVLAALGLIAGHVAFGCTESKDSADDCKRTATCKPEGNAGGATTTDTSSTVTSHTGGASSIQSAPVGGAAGESSIPSEGGTAGSSATTVTEPCNGECTGHTPICDEATNTCVACLANTDCTRDITAPICNPATNSCVSCLTNADCPAAEASRCDTTTNTCTSCSEDKDCAQVAGKTVCLTGDATLPNQCVQCTGKKYAACGAAKEGTLVCDSANHRCSTDKTVKSAGLCQPCVSDAQCRDGQLCALQKYNNKPVGYFCFWKEGNTVNGAPEKCFTKDSRVYVNEVTDVVSVDGQIATLCMLASATTCVALNQFRATDCAPTGVPDDQLCGFAPGGDSKCVETTSGSGTYRCTTTCGSDDDCRAGFSCDIGVTPPVCKL